MRRIRILRIVSVVACVAAGCALGRAPSTAQPSVHYVDIATPFEKAVTDTVGQPEASRIAIIRDRISAILPDIYRRDASTDRMIAVAITEFPSKQAAYDRVVADFPLAISGAVESFRLVFPEFKSPLPIYLYHSLGQRDGGADYIEPGRRHVMLFGADMIAKYHSDNSLQPFLAHELFHLEHARHFADCDQFWCSFWQEGLAVDAAATMTPHATDRQLLLDIPKPIRLSTDTQWEKALCFVAAHFDDTDGVAVEKSLQMAGNPPMGLPDRFGYYVGNRVARETNLKLEDLSRLNNRSARPVVFSALTRLMNNAHTRCPQPKAKSVVTYRFQGAV